MSRPFEESDARSFRSCWSRANSCGSGPARTDRKGPSLTESSGTGLTVRSLHVHVGPAPPHPSSVPPARPTVHILCITIPPGRAAPIPCGTAPHHSSTWPASRPPDSNRSGDPREGKIGRTGSVGVGSSALDRARALALSFPIHFSLSLSLSLLGNFFVAVSKLTPPPPAPLRRARARFISRPPI
ncbi:hypothetical protein NL676_030861 [Syzygium grande]|nr:hypothetical protein NL676_030861 [Syzygium grande]